MIQVLGLRDHTAPDGKQKKREVFFQKGWRFERIQDVFDPEKVDALLANVPDSEKYNLYFTVADCFEESGRKLREQWVIPFDIDSIEMEEGKEHETCLRAAQLAAEALQVPFEDVGVIFSGHGVWIYIFTDKPIVEEHYFDYTRDGYGLLCKRIQGLLDHQGIKCKVDPTAWSKGRLSRLPHTINRKPGKPERRAVILNRGGKAHSYDVEAQSGIVGSKVHEHVDPNVLKTYPKPDVKAVCEGCKFLVHCHTKQAEIKEYQWYAAISVWAWLDEDGAIAHAGSEQHPEYSHYETTNKIEQAKTAAGPRTCKNIDSLWDGCKDCEYYGKITSPILIKGPDYIRTKDTGFRSLNDKGMPGRVEFEDLIKQFEQDYTYKTLMETNSLVVYNGVHWEDWNHKQLKNWMRNKVTPAPTDSDMREFVSRITVENLTTRIQMVAQRDGFMNFKNCVVDVKTGTVHPHSPHFGFFDVRPYAYDANAKSPTWDKFLLDVMGNDEQAASILSEFGGYAISGDNVWFQSALLLVGDGSNGKSVYMEMLGEVVGDGNHSAVSMQDLAKEQARYQLLHKLFNYSEETSPEALSNSSTFKALTSGGKILIKELWAQPYLYANRAKLIMSANEMPYSKDKTYGFLRRMVIVEFNQTFTPGDGKHDYNIKDKLRSELPGICNSLMNAYRRMLEQGRLTAQDKVVQSIQKYREESDTVLMFLDEFVVTDKDGYVASTELYMDYVSETKNRGHFPVTHVAFSKAVMKLMKIPTEQKKLNNKNVRVFMGIRKGKDF